MLNYLILLVSLVATVVLMAMLNFTTPTEIGPLGVLVFFTTLYLVVFGLAVMLIWLFVKMTRKGVMRRKDYYYAVVIAFGPILVLLVQSFGQISLATLGLVVLFILLACFAINKRL